MNILIYTSVFYPSTGGMETVAEVLATGFAKSGHVVTLVTTTKLHFDEEEKAWPFKIYRNLSFYQYFKLLKGANVVLHNCVSLKQVFPDWLYRHKVFVIHHTWYRLANGNANAASNFKRWISRWVHNCFISNAIQRDLKLPGKVIPNPYNSNLFKNHNPNNRPKELIFLGRLVSDKGAQVLLEALRLANTLDGDFKPQLTVVGEGSERHNLESFAVKFLPRQVQFLGQLQGQILVNTLNQHQVMVVPSSWEEPFGVVALEGLACGCLVIGSEKGGLTDAIGPCGWTFPNGDVKALANMLIFVLNNSSLWLEKKKAIKAHLHNHQPEQVVEAYLNYFKAYV